MAGGLFGQSGGIIDIVWLRQSHQELCLAKVFAEGVLFRQCKGGSGFLSMEDIEGLCLTQDELQDLYLVKEWMEVILFIQGTGSSGSVL